MLRIFKEFFSTNKNVKDWQMAYHQLKVKHESLCDYIKDYHHSEAMILVEISDKIRELNCEKAKLNKRLLNHESNVSKLDM